MALALCSHTLQPAASICDLVHGGSADGLSVRACVKQPLPSNNCYICYLDITIIP